MISFYGQIASVNNYFVRDGKKNVHRICYDPSLKLAMIPSVPESIINKRMKWWVVELDNDQVEYK